MTLNISAAVAIVLLVACTVASRELPNSQDKAPFPWMYTIIKVHTSSNELEPPHVVVTTHSIPAETADASASEDPMPAVAPFRNFATEELMLDRVHRVDEGLAWDEEQYDEPERPLPMLPRVNRMRGQSAVAGVADPLRASDSIAAVPEEPVVLDVEPYTRRVDPDQSLGANDDVSQSDVRAQGAPHFVMPQPEEPDWLWTQEHYDMDAGLIEYYPDYYEDQKQNQWEMLQLSAREALARAYRTALESAKARAASQEVKTPDHTPREAYVYVALGAACAAGVLLVGLVAWQTYRLVRARVQRRRQYLIADLHEPLL